MGCVTLAAQALLLRELLVLWQGSEISIAAGLAMWLAVTGCGCLLGGVAARRTRNPVSALAWALAALGALVPVSVATARLARAAMGTLPGELAGVGPLITATAAAVGPFTALSGVAFALAVASSSRWEPNAGRAMSRVYVLEAVGAVAAGLIISLALFDRLAPLQIAFLAAALACAGAIAALSFASPGTPRRRIVPLVAAAAVAVLGSTARVGGFLEDGLTAAAWRDAGVVLHAHSRYGLIVATERGSQKSLFENGVLAASVPDRLAAEETVHIPLLQHPRPESVLLLGGALGGGAQEALKHPTVRRVDCVELDPALIEAARRAFGTAMTAALDDPRVTVHYADARFFVKRAPAETYDAVIVNVPDPTTAQMNRFYTQEFMREVRKALSPGGVAAFTLSSSEDYVGPEQAALLACVRGTLASVFAEVRLLPGDPCHIVASDAPDFLSVDATTLASRIEGRRLDVAYVRSYYLDDRLSPERVAYLEERVAAEDAPINTDLSPACTYLTLVLWTQRLSRGPNPFAAARRAVTMPHVAAVAAALAVALGALALRRRGGGLGLRTALPAAVAVAGLAEIGLEIAALVAVQSLYGSVYHRIAVIVGAFMGGLAFGGWLGGRSAERGAGPRAALAIAGGLAAAPLGVAAAVQGAAALPPGLAALGSAIIPLAVVGSAVLAGMLFPVAGRILATEGGAARTGSRLYGADLLGAAAGALVTGVMLLPLLGLWRAMLSLSLLNAAAVAALLLSVAVTRPARA
ncbi:MAG: hypothetical protein FJY74_02455 [Candidatus Eisenbacteria bacterium]|nr:hypothetical protein [Candidatus Eisenbacteria bacterium]